MDPLTPNLWTLAADARKLARNARALWRKDHAPRDN